MIRPTVGFLVYGVHKDGLQDPMGQPFIDDALIARSKQALRDRGVDLVEHDTVLATKEEARAALKKMKDDDRDRLRGPVLRHVGLGGPHDRRHSRFRHDRQGRAHLDASRLAGLAAGRRAGAARRPCWRSASRTSSSTARPTIRTKSTRSSASAAPAHMQNWLNMSTIGTFGGRGMGQTCGVADPSQWMKMFGVDIDSRDTTELIRTAQQISDASWPRWSRASSSSSAAAREERRQRALDAAVPGDQEAGGQERLGFLHDPVVPRAGRRLQRHLLCPEHDARRRLRHLDPGRLQHGADACCC